MKMIASNLIRGVTGLLFLVRARQCPRSYGGVRGKRKTAGKYVLRGGPKGRVKRAVSFLAQTIFMCVCVCVYVSVPF